MRAVCKYFQFLAKEIPDFCVSIFSTIVPCVYVCVCCWVVGGPYAFPAWFSPNRDLFVVLSGGPVDGWNDDDGDNARWQRGVVVMR